MTNGHTVNMPENYGMNEDRCPACARMRLAETQEERDNWAHVVECAQSAALNVLTEVIDVPNA